ncbi:DoxX family protein [soil metagenome]
MATATAQTPAQSSGKGLRIALWIAQVLLALAFGASGLMKLVTPIAELAKSMPWIADMPALIRFIGTSELLGAIGLILPSATRVLPKLTVAAAIGLVVVMILAAGFHFSRGEADHTPVNFVLGGVAAFIAWGRWKKAPISPR